ncbi:MAG TPA: circularly permuted type 2 ATP-grasp protein [Candidatus Eremiobacteraceae bacterium]|nr:circularly permuted type 2 ATP-grasp protein [Candidatus Eremiobacteraceae bacterium]
MGFAARATTTDAALTRAIDRYNALCADPALVDTDLIASFSDSMRREGLTFNGAPQCRSLRPSFLTKERVEELNWAVRAFASALEIIERRALADPSVARELGLSADEAALAAVDPGYDGSTAVSRLDTFFDERVQVVEYNADSPAGMSYDAGQARLIRELPVMQRFMKEYEVEHVAADRRLRESLLSVWSEFRRRKMPQAPSVPAVAIVDLAGAPTTAEFHLVAREFMAHGVKAFVCSPDDLMYDRTGLHAGGVHIDLVYRRLLVSDFLTRYDLRHPLAAAYRAGAVCVASSFRCKFAHKKMALAMMCDPAKRSWFDESQLDAIARLLPQTSALEGGNASHALASRESLVLKPNDDYGGRNVIVGWECDADVWRTAIEEAVRTGGFVVQARAAARYEDFPIFSPDEPEEGFRIHRLLTDCNPFIFRNGEVGGYLTRLSPTAIVNVARGGQAVPTFVIALRETRQAP